MGSQGQKVGLKGGDQSKLDPEEEKGQNRAKLFHKEQACKLLTSIVQKKSKMPEVLQTAGQAKVERSANQVKDDRWSGFRKAQAVVKPEQHNENVLQLSVVVGDERESKDFVLTRILINSYG